MNSRKIVFVSLIGLFCLSPLSFLVSQALAQSDVGLYREALNQIQENALLLKPGSRPQDIVRDMLRAYLKTLDRFSEYLSPEEYAAFKASQKSSYVGIGMEIERDAAGQIMCIPLANSPAARAGIREGDILQAVDGQDVAGKSLIAVTTMARGEEGTPVALTIWREQRAQTIIVQREALRAESVSLTWQADIPIISISFFTSSTQRELKIALTELKPAPCVVLDLRGNSGGDLHAAIDSAMLFLNPDEKIVSIETRKGIKPPYKSTRPALITKRLLAWQDKRTASAAEVFIAALTQNKRAESIGEISYGKGTMQDVIELQDGSALMLTTGYLQTPDGTRYHERGLRPTYPLGVATPQTEHYLAKVRELNGQYALPRPESSGRPAETLENREAASASPVSQPTVSVSSPGMETPQQSKSDVYLLCFDKNFDTEEQANNWAAVIRQSLNDVPVQYLLQRETSTGVKYMVCLGQFLSEAEAAQKRDVISKAVSVPLFIKAIKSSPMPSSQKRNHPDEVRWRERH